MRKIPGAAKILIMVVSPIIVVVFLVYAGNYLGLSDRFSQNLAYVLPGLVTFMIGAAMILTIKTSIFFVPSFGVMGVGLAILLEEMYTVGIVVDALFVPLTLVEVQIIIIILSILFGGVAAAVTQR